MHFIPAFLIALLIWSQPVSAEDQNKQPIDYRAEVARLSPLADEGNPIAQLQLGLILRSGIGGMPKDPERAFKYILSSAEKHIITSQYLTAQMYAEGWGVRKDKTAALKWAGISAGRGSQYGAKLAGKLRRDLDRDSIVKAQSMIDAWSPATLIDGRPIQDYSESCAVLGVQIKEALDFMEYAKTDELAKQVFTASGGVRWSSLAMIYPSVKFMGPDIGHRLQALQDIFASKNCR